MPTRQQHCRWRQMMKAIALQPYKVEDAAGNPLPAGLSLKANDAQERFIQGTATADVGENEVFLYRYRQHGCYS